MDQQHLLYYILLFIWLLPFTFGSGKRHDDILNTCMDGKYHKDMPGYEPTLFSQCIPWRSRSCCTNETSKSLHESRHHKFNLDHCSSVQPLSKECKKHFIQDLCFYECSPNIGPWLVKVNMKVRKERFFKVPLCLSDCLDWYEACKSDFTCNGNWLRGWSWSSEGNSCLRNSTCETFEKVFHNATNFCEKVWDHSWKVVEDDKPCMRIWFDPEKGNPNDAVAKYYALNSSSSTLRTFRLTPLSFFLHSLFIFFLCSR